MIIRLDFLAQAILFDENNELMAIVNGNVKVYLLSLLLFFKRSKICTKMIQYCHSNGNNFLSVRRCGSYFDGSAPSIPHLVFSRFRTFNSAPKMRFRTDARCGGSEGGAEVPISASYLVCLHYFSKAFN